MSEWYFDIETEGTDPQQDRILTIQYQPIDGVEAAGSFQVLAEWEWGEKEIVRLIVEKGLLDPTWDFVPVGNRLKFDITFVMEKAEKYEIKKFTLESLRYYWFTKPVVDLTPVLQLMNDGRFQGTPAAGSPGKSHSSDVPRLYHDGKYADIIEYVTREKDETLALIRDSSAMLKDFAVGRHGQLNSATR